MKIFYCKNFKERNKYLKYQYSDKNLTEERQVRMNQIKDQEAKENFLMSEFITIELLERMYGIKNPRILGKAGEKPRVEGNDKIHFSRSYADRNMVIAIEVNHPVGIDGEEIMAMDEKLMESFFTKEEREYVEKSSDKNVAFTVIWTRKESYMKYTGEGLKTEFQLLNTAPESYEDNQVDIISNVLISQIKLKNTQKLILPPVMIPVTFENQPELYIKTFIVNNTVVSVTGEGSSMKEIAYQEKRSYEEKSNRLFWKNSQSMFQENSHDGQGHKTNL